MHKLAIVDDRYALLRPLGSGSAGQVYLAEDRTTGQRVAVKILYRLEDGARQRFERERTALESLDETVGVVRILASGSHGERPYIAMDYVPGWTFPGPDRVMSWSLLEPLAVDLLRTMSRVHATDIIHRDLNPNNVRVSSAGRVVVLDFGLARGRPLGHTLTGTGDIVGTPPYLAPEQIHGGPYDARTDLYAIGVMLYEALAGVRPLTAPSVIAYLRAKLYEDPAPLRQLAPDVPEHVASTIDRMVARQSHIRPSSAAIALEMLAGNHAAPPRPPMVGRAQELTRLWTCVQSGTSIDVSGPPGCGKSRLLAALSARAVGDGRAVLAPLPASEPLESLRPLLPQVPFAQASDLNELLAAVDRALVDLLSGGAIIVADDFDQLDSASREALDRVRSAGCVVRVPEQPEVPVLAIEPLGSEDLAALVDGPEPFLHVKSDAARELAARTRGNAQQLMAELGHWVASGVASWTDAGTISMDRGQLRRAAQAPLAPVATLELQTKAPTSTLLAWVELLDPYAEVEHLSAAADKAVWKVELELQELVERGFVQRSGQGYRTRSLGFAARIWTPEQLRVRHLRAAAWMPAGHPARIRHLALGEAYEKLVDDAIVAVSKLAEGGDFEVAVDVLTFAAATLLVHDLDSSVRVFEELIICAIAEESAMAAARAATLLDGVAHTRLARLYQVATGAVSVTTNAGPALDSEIESIPCFEDRRLEGARQSLRFRAAMRIPDLALAQRRLVDMAAFSKAHDDDVHARHLGWWGTLRLRESRFGEAMEHFADAADTSRSVLVRLAATLNLALAAREAFAYDRCGDAARAVLEVAVPGRHHVFEGAATWVLRTLDYRRGHPLEPQPYLATVAASFDPALAAGLAINEGAAAWRRQEAGIAQEMGQLAATLYGEMGFEIGSRLGLALAAAAGDDTVDLPRLVDEVPCDLPRLAYQVVGLAQLATERGHPNTGFDLPPRDLLQALRASLPPAQHGQRLEVLSFQEVVEALAL